MADQDTPPSDRDQFGARAGDPGFNPNSTSNAALAAAPQAPTVAQNPYDLTKILGPAPVVPQGPAPQVGQFVESPGGGAGMGHFATQEDVQAHHDAWAAAKQYADLASHFHQLHNETQQNLDTGGAFHELTGFNSAHPDAEANLAAVRAKYPNARPEAFQYAEKALAARQAQAGKMTLEQQKAADKAAAKDAFSTDLEKNYNVSPATLMNEVPQAGKYSPVTKAGEKQQFIPAVEGTAPAGKEGDATHIMIHDKNGKAKFLTVQDYYRLKGQALEHYGPTQAAAAGVDHSDAAVAARAGITAPAPAGGGGVPKPAATPATTPAATPPAAAPAPTAVQKKILGYTGG